MIESALLSSGDSIIIVPLVALLNQVKSDINKVNKIKYERNIKIITHHEISPSESCKNIYVLTQERCYQILKKNGFKNITNLFIDESHKLLTIDPSGRSLKLCEVIYILKKKYDVIINYYSPVLQDASSIRIKGFKKIKAIQNIRDIKSYEYYFYKKDNNSKRMIIPFTDSITKTFEIDSGYTSKVDYIIKNSKNKNIVFLDTPKSIEEFSLNFIGYLQAISDLDYSDLVDFVGEEYYVCDTLKYGVIYIHGQMPELIRSYLLDLYRSNSKIMYLVTNSTILEGVNTPSDNLFIYECKKGGKILKPKDFINLRGRINRLSEVVKESDLSKIKCSIHFVCKTSLANIKNIINKCYNNVLEDDIENPYLLNNVKEPEKVFEDSLIKIGLVYSDNSIKSDFNIDINVNQLKDIEKKCMVNDVVLNELQKEDLNKRFGNNHDRQINDVKELLVAMDYLFNLENDDNYELSRLSIEKVRNFYSMLITWDIEEKAIRQKTKQMCSYYKKQSNDTVIYIGKRGDMYAELINGKIVVLPNQYSKTKFKPDGKPVIREHVWILNNKPYKEMYNLFIVKLKVEQDFIAFRIIPLIETINDVDDSIISKELYNRIKYKTTNEFEIALIKEGVSSYLAKELNNDKYKKYIDINNGLKISDKIINVFSGNSVLITELNTLV